MAHPTLPPTRPPGQPTFSMISCRRLSSLFWREEVLQTSNVTIWHEEPFRVKVVALVLVLREKDPISPISDMAKGLRYAKR